MQEINEKLKKKHNKLIQKTSSVILKQKVEKKPLNIETVKNNNKNNLTLFQTTIITKRRLNDRIF